MSATESRRYYYGQRRQDAPAPVNPWAIRLPLLMVTGIFLSFFALVAAVAGYQFIYSGKIYPGVSTVFGQNIAGMSPNEAETSLEEEVTFSEDSVIAFRYEDQTWEYTAAELGLQFDVNATVEAAYQVGRDDNTIANLSDQWDTWLNGYPVVPVITYDQAQAQQVINGLAQDHIDQPVLDATLAIRDLRAYATPSQAGYTLDTRAALNLLQREIVKLNGYSEIDLTPLVRQQQPEIQDAQEAARLVNIALDPRGVTFVVATEDGGDAGPWTADPESIENMLRIERMANDDGTAYYDVRLETNQVEDFLRRIAPELIRDPVNARFIFNDESRLLEVLEPSINGRSLNVEATVPTFTEAVFSTTDRTVPLVFNIDVPPIHDEMTGEELGITEQVVAATTYFYNSTAARRTNVQVAASRFHGLVIPPQSEFSFNQWLGDVSLDEGYESALIIVGDRTITGVGGGVCQVSTTVFQSAFYGGFPILERYPHGYRVAYYEQGEGPGMDATVYSPVVDFRFLNDTDYHLLIETYVDVNRSSVTFKFYSTDTGRTVQKFGPNIRNVKPAPPAIYRANGNLAPGQVRQVDYAVSGADVYVYRTIRDADGNILVDKEEFFSRYLPWPAQFEVAPGDRRING
jgi:vancomycin resistance protein YoaR